MEYALNDFLNKNSSKTKHFSKFLFLTLSMASKLLSNHKIKIFHVGWALSMNLKKMRNLVLEWLEI